MAIGRLARAVGAGVETVCHDGRRNRLPTPVRPSGGYRTHGAADMARPRFICRARVPGLSLADVAEVLRVADARDRRPSKAAARRSARVRLAPLHGRHGVRDRVAARVLPPPIDERQPSAGRLACPIIERSMAEPAAGSGDARQARPLV
ncbi:MAG: hypothetical protein OHK0044_18320 [Burkholderiaceae bacterium]